MIAQAEYEELYRKHRALASYRCNDEITLVIKWLTDDICGNPWSAVWYNALRFNPQIGIRADKDTQWFSNHSRSLTTTADEIRGSYPKRSRSKSLAGK